MVFLLLVFLTFFFLAPNISQADLYRFTDQEGNTFFTNTPGEGREKISWPPGPGKSRSLSPASLRQPRETIEPIIASAGKNFSVDPDLIRAVIQAESNFNPQAVSPKGAMGLMQLMPATAREMAISDPFDPEENIQGGVRYLSELLRLLNQRLPLALAAYNAGPDKVLGRNEIPPIEETRDYVQRVLRNYKNFKYQKR